MAKKYGPYPIAKSGSLSEGGKYKWITFRRSRKGKWTTRRLK